MNPKSKRKSEWAGIDDSFALPKRPRITKSSDIQFGSLLDFPAPNFEQHSSTTPSSSKGKGKAPTFSLHSHISDFSLQPSSRKTKPEASATLTTPKPPQPRLPAHLNISHVSSSAREKDWISLTDAPLPVLQPAFEPSPSTPKNMQNAFRTPLIPDSLAFTSPPASQELDVPLSQILGARDMSPKRLSSREMELARGLAPSPVKGGGSPKKTFVRGGLADRAKLFMTRSTTDFSLWYQDISFNSSTATPSLRVCVKDVISQYPSHELPLLSQGTQSPAMFSCVVTRCWCIDGPQGVAASDVFILFKTSASRGTQSVEGARKRVADASVVSVGREVHMWQPWTEVQIPINGKSECTETTIALLCSRFLVK